MRSIRCLVAVVLAGGIAAVVYAQPGFGGFGTPDVMSLVVSNADLQTELKITDEQKDKFKPIMEEQDEMNKAMRELFGGGGFDKEKMTELNEKRQKLTEKTKKVVDETLTEEQKKRAKQIQIQAMAFAVFDDPDAKPKFGRGASESQKAIMKEVQSALKLSDSQKSSVKGIRSDFNKEQQEIMRDSGAFGKGGFDQEKLDEAMKKVEKVRKEAWEKVVEAFDEDQQKTWKELTGEAFDTSKLNQFRFGQPKKD